MQQTIDNITATEFTELANKARLANRDKWVFINSILSDGRDVQYKAYNTYIQILKIDGVNYAQGMDERVAAFKTTLESIKA